MEVYEWNMNQYFYDELHNVRMVKIQAFAEGDYPLYIDMLDEIYAMVSFKFDKKERKEIEQMFTELQKYQDILEDIRLGRVGMEEMQAYKMLLRKIDTRIMELMHKNKMVLPKQEYFDPMKEEARRYGLKD